MKATGIVRRIDDLGRVVIPKEIRRTMRIREGEPMEIFTGKEGEIVLKKYSPIEELGNLAREYVQAVAQTLGGLVCVTDHDVVVAASGARQQEYQGKSISKELESLISQRDNIQKKDSDNGKIPIIEKDEMSFGAQLVLPILAAGDAIGSVSFLGKKDGGDFTESDRKIAMVAAKFLGQQMEN